VIGVDILIRPDNRKAIENHELSSRITLIEGSSTDLNVFNIVKSKIKKDEKVMVILDSNHSKSHVLKELEMYHQLLSIDSYIVATDGSMKELHDTPRGFADWSWNNPYAAAEEFVSSRNNFVIEQPTWPFNESGLLKNITHWPGAWIRKINQ
jgi:cephalosporin hydroxylase